MLHLKPLELKLKYEILTNNTLCEKHLKTTTWIQNGITGFTTRDKTLLGEFLTSVFGVNNKVYRH